MRVLLKRLLSAQRIENIKALFEKLFAGLAAAFFCKK